MNKKRTYLLISFLTLILGLAKFAPATIVAQYVASKTANTILLTNAQGTIWDGNAELAINPDQAQIQEVNQPLVIGQIEWNIKGSSLFLGELKIEFNWNKVESGLLTLSRSNMFLDKLSFDLPANTITTLVPSLSIAQLGGQLHISSPNFSISNLNKSNINPKFSGQILLDWQQASSPLSPINPLGRYQVHMNGVNEQIAITVATLNGPLILEGEGTLSHENGLQFNANASAVNSQKQSLTPLLHVLGNETNLGSGFYKIHIRH